MFAKTNIYKSVAIFLFSFTLLVAALLFWPTAQVHADPIAEVEPNDSSGTAQELLAIGSSNPVNGNINPSGDEDWFKFEAIAGETYVIELYNVALSLSQGQTWSYCGPSNWRTGMPIHIYDSTVTEVASQCTPSGAGNVHNIAEFTTGISGTYYVRTYSHVPSNTGYYSLRILPKFDQDNAEWDSSTFEPNNRASNAYMIDFGYTNALQTEFEARNSSFSTNNGDIDWYRFEAQAGEVYVIELFEVATGLDEGQVWSYCGPSNWRTGVPILVYDPTVTLIASQCTPSGAGNVHNILEFTAGLSGIFYIQVFPHVNSNHGAYSIRVSLKYDQAAPEWDAITYEPNNRAVNGYLLENGISNTLSSEFETRNSSYATNAGDIDWYRFEAEAGQSYTIELFNVASSLDIGEVYYSCGGQSFYYRGVPILVYDPTFTLVASQCRPEASGTAYNYLPFTPGVSGEFHILVYPHISTNSGTYSIRLYTEAAEKVFLPFVKH